MKGNTLLMLLFCFALSVTIGFANADVNELNRSDEVILVNDAISISNQVEFKTSYGLDKINSYANVNKDIDNVIRAFNHISSINISIAILPDKHDGGRSPPERVVKNLQHKDKIEKPLNT